ncbi:triose-phosphate transporter family-domain-containing protein [Hyaloraphidium curvatum]|nr:triose-phosphate transporter family-domain-containing protein [Hyaloraphidium curvatum]
MSAPKEERETFLASGPSSSDVKIQIKPFEAAVRTNTGTPFSGDNAKTVFWVLLNIVTSVLIVTVNKWVFTTDKFNFGTTLTVLHFLVTTVGLEILARVGFFEKKQLSIPGVLPLAICFSGFVVLTNLSLQLNSVGFYQCAKVLTTPTIVFIQRVFYGVQMTSRIKISIAIILVGVTIATVTDVELNFWGTIVAFAGVVVTSLYQIFVGTKQKELQCDALQLLYYQAPISAATLIFAVPFFDDMEALRNYEWNAQAIQDIVLSALLAFGVNISIYGIIGRTSPVTYNVVGHFKTACVLVVGFVVFKYPVLWKNILGIVLTVAGVIDYTQVKMAETPAAR